MHAHSNINPNAVTAVYTQSRIPRYKDNALIEALPPLLDYESLGVDLFDLPEFDSVQRTWPAHERIHMVSELLDSMVVLNRHVHLGWAVDMLVRQGYVARVPRTASHTRTYQKLYEARKANAPFSVRTKQNATAQLSSALLGVSGVGKTSSLKRILNLYPQVIYHPDLDITQITYLHIEAPHDGVSTKGLAFSILRELDRLIPDGNYYERFGKKSYSAETLLNHAARLMHTHCVGLLVADEIQNLKNGGKSMEKMMALLVSASNELGVPILFVGTNRAANVLGLDASPARRSVGNAIYNWTALQRSSDLKKPDEWEDFISTVWPFQWLHNPVPLTQSLSDLMFHHSQGITDIAVKLFASVQWQCILDQSETITAQVIEQVWKRDFELIHTMMDAYRLNDPEALDKYHDIAPLKSEKLLDNALNRYEGVRVREKFVRPGHRDFVPTITATLKAMGIDAELASQIASSVETDGKAKNLLDGTQAALDKVKPPKKTKATKEGAADQRKSAAELPPDDYRNAIAAARDGKTTVFAQLDAMGHVCDLDELLELS
ncbi:AAA family ATPase [Paraburkholderia azotifigens]|uniref:AAA family ATPase n=1 Tax=Paraburkholderia azotifigens TaxID=2057004 RepID=A0A5C6V8E7_9BURK|nr:AAA family ATPase [Paraburkholderia azotifigens]TXC81030.1 AAA family ATPase [Paraburkholderia azotifigens]